MNDALRTRILERDGYICVYCQMDANEVDHVVPRSWEDCDDEDNLVASCRTCNLIAGNMMFDTLKDKYNFIRKRRERMRRLASTISICSECGKLFKPRAHGSTLFLCAICALGAGMDPSQRFYFLELVNEGVDIPKAKKLSGQKLARESLAGHPRIASLRAQNDTDAGVVPTNDQVFLERS